MPRLVVPIFVPSGSVLRGQLNHAVVGQNHMSAVGNEKMTVDCTPASLQRARLFQKRNWIKHDAIADDAAATGAQHAAGHKLEDKLFALDDDGVAGIVSAGVAGHDGEVLRQHVDNLAFALIAPLGTQNDR